MWDSPYKLEEKRQRSRYVTPLIVMEGESDNLLSDSVWTSRVEVSAGTLYEVIHPYLH